MTEDLYALLGVSPEASIDDIKKQWRQKARDLHPDKGGDQHQLSKINAAYDTLKDPQKRAEYDAQRNSPFTNQRTNMNFDSAFGDIFAHMFQQHQRTQKIIDDPLTLEQLCQGTKKQLTLKRRNTEEKIHINIPPGLEPDQVLHLDTQNGPLTIRIRLKPHDHFIINNDDIYTRYRLSLSKAIEGGTLKITDPYGNHHTLTLPQSVQSGTRLHVRNAGMTTPFGRGNLNVILHVETPRNLTTKQKQTIKNILNNNKTEQEKPSLWENLRETIGL